MTLISDGVPIGVPSITMHFSPVAGSVMSPLRQRNRNPWNEQRESRQSASNTEHCLNTV